MSEVKVTFPDELIEGFNLEGSIVGENVKEVGFTLLSEIEHSKHILRIYKLLLDEHDQTYHPVEELAAFAFENRNQLEEFAERLPYINGLEMLLLLNPDNLNNENQLN